MSASPPMEAPLPPGARAPDFTAVASDGGAVSLADALRASRVLLIFYPGNDTPG